MHVIKLVLNVFYVNTSTFMSVIMVDLLSYVCFNCIIYIPDLGLLECENSTTEKNSFAP